MKSAKSRTAVIRKGLRFLPLNIELHARRETTFRKHILEESFILYFLNCVGSSPTNAVSSGADLVPTELTRSSFFKLGSDFQSHLTMVKTTENTAPFLTISIRNISFQFRLCSTVCIVQSRKLPDVSRWRIAGSLKARRHTVFFPLDVI